MPWMAFVFMSVRLSVGRPLMLMTLLDVSLKQFLTWHVVEKAVEQYIRMGWMMPLHRGGKKWGATWSLFSLQMASLVNVDCVLVKVEVVCEAEDSTVNLMM